MVIVAGILGVELPVPADPLAIIAEHLHGPVEEPLQLSQDWRTEIVFERLGILGQCAKQRPVDITDPQWPEPVRSHLEARIEPALAPDPAAERYRCQAAVEPIAPLMIDADVVGGVAGELAPYQCPAMGATVDKGLDRARLVDVADDRCLADIGRAEISR